MSNDNLFLVKYSTPEGTTGLGLDDGQALRPLGQQHPIPNQPDMLDWLLSSDPDAPPADNLLVALRPVATEPIDHSSINIVSPVGQQEIWAAGVTYKRSEEAREAESNNSTIYTRVYSAKRPEIFFKANGYDVVPLGGQVGIRADATWSVPEPELVVVMNARMEV